MQPVMKASFQSAKRVAELTPRNPLLTNQTRILDVPSSNSNAEPGFSNVSLSNYSTPNSGQFRRNSNSSIASDISFLPRYESATNLYHIQSDLDISASEVEDNASTSSQLGNLTKEQIYAAFQKAQLRYHKYRGRYTDIASHYKELERENTKIKSILVETQDKALRRLSELKEQCLLEQKAKAHLENALQVELDEKQYVIDTLKTKISLLQTSIKNVDSGKPQLLVDVNNESVIDNCDNLEILTKDLKEARIEIENLNSKIQEMKANAIVFNSKEADLKRKIFELEEINKQKILETDQILERERENNLIIAQTKMELHTEIQNRDLEIENLKEEIETLIIDLNTYENKSQNTKIENLQSQNTKLIDKIEELQQKCKNYESELLKLEQLKIEIANLKSNRPENLEIEVNQLNNKLIEEQQRFEKLKTEYDQSIADYRDDAKQRLLTLENKIRDKMQAEFSKKEEDLICKFQEKLQELSKSNSNLQEIQLQLLDKNKLVKNLEFKLENLESSIENKDIKYNDLEKNHLELISESADTRNQLKCSLEQLHELKKEITKLNKKVTEAENLQESAADLHTKLVNVQSQNENFVKERIQLQETISNLELSIEDIKKLNSNFQERISELIKTNETLQEDLQKSKKTLKEEKIDFNDEIKNLMEEILVFKEKNASIQSSIDEYKQRLNDYEAMASEKNIQLQELIKDKSTFVVETDALKERLEKSQSESIKLNEELLQQNVLLQQVVDENNKLKNQICLIQVETNKNMAANEELKAELASCRKIEIDYQLQISNLKAIEIDCKKIQEEKLQLQNEIMEIKGQINVLNQENRQYQERIVKFQEQEGQNQQLQDSCSRLDQEISELNQRNNKLSSDYKQIAEENESLLQELAEIKLQINLLDTEKLKWENSEAEKEKLKHELNQHRAEIEKLQVNNSEAILSENKVLKVQLEELKSQSELYENQKKNLEKQLRELENQYTEVEHEKQLLRDEIEELKTAPLNINTHSSNIKKLESLDVFSPEKSGDVQMLLQNHEKEINHLNEKLIQYKSLDLTNRSSIQFYENELQKLKNKNEKLNRKLDETLVTLNHCAEISTSTEAEYLKNVLYNYMLGKEGLILARVIAAVCKFDEDQTEAILQREQQKQTLLGQLGFL